MQFLSINIDCPNANFGLFATGQSPEGKTGKETSASSRLDLLEKFLVNNFI